MDFDPIRLPQPDPQGPVPIRGGPKSSTEEATPRTGTKGLPRQKSPAKSRGAEWASRRRTHYRRRNHGGTVVGGRRRRRRPRPGPTRPAPARPHRSSGRYPRPDHHLLAEPKTLLEPRRHPQPDPAYFSLTFPCSSNSPGWPPPPPQPPQ
ncbi:proline-rich receptor-like protein kinase PERK10 [Mustela erminea]|uniref:proline-rich receptor-like protein kinase PERK10 n=1 Tax=Mustela erminea TaxID=36723 RepID=UPI001386AE70|nr:proline-rich receptor-like protein kinase PERK10 [Mustela erminea]